MMPGSGLRYIRVRPFWSGTRHARVRISSRERARSPYTPRLVPELGPPPAGPAEATRDRPLR